MISKHFCSEELKGVSEPCQTCKMERFAKMVNGFQGSEYASLCLLNLLLCDVCFQSTKPFLIKAYSSKS